MEPYVFLSHVPGMPNQQEPPPPHDPKMRKRTKTGCLTCRKRRIKCGEERPTCANCTKSKRHCEGYTQRIVFRDPTRYDAGESIPYHNSVLPGQPRNVSQPLQLVLPSGQVAFLPPGFARDQHGQLVPLLPATPITPMAPPSAGPFAALGPNGVLLYAQQHQHNAGTAWQSAPQLPPQTSTDYPWTFAPPLSINQSMAFNPISTAQQAADHTATQSFVTPQLTPGYEEQRGAGDNALFKTEIGHEWDSSFAQQHAIFHRTQVEVPWHTEENPSYENQSDHVTKRIKREQHDSSALPVSQAPPLRDTTNSRQPNSSIRQASYTIEHRHTYQPNIVRPETYDASCDDTLLAAGVPEEIVVKDVNELLQGAAIEMQDDEYADYDSAWDDSAVMANPAGNLQLLREIHHQHVSSSGMRRYDAFLYPGMLDHYHAAFHASPLKNPRTARVFAHFICATAPSLGIFERTPRNTEALFGSAPSLHAHQQSLWTYALPMRALNSLGLLHAMLALASLHIANLQRGDKQPSVRHYTYATKIVNKAVSSEVHRHRVETLAATLLLGYYEVMTADHAKWCLHLLGGRAILNEIGYPSMSKQARRLRIREQIRRQTDEYGYPQASFAPDGYHVTVSTLLTAVDENLISTLIGRRLKFDEFGQVFEPAQAGFEQQRDSVSPGSEQLDLETYDLYQDLWWWFLRQDAYQSIVSGNGLLLNYARWSDCPPRARMGRSDAPYGGHDHIMLILGRIADFSARDRRRKLKYIKSHGGQWAPPPQGFFPGLGHMPPPPTLGPPLGHVAPSAPSVPNAGGSQSRVRQGQGASSYGAPQLATNPLPDYSKQFDGSGQSATRIGSLNGVSPMGTDPQKPAPPPFMGMAPSSDKRWMPSSYRSSHPANNAASPTSSDSSTPDKDALATALQEWSSIQTALGVLRNTFRPMLEPIDSDLAVSQSYHVLEEPFGPAILYRKGDVALLNALYHLCNIVLCRAHPNMHPASIIAAGAAASFTSDSAMQIGRIATGIFSQALSTLTTSRLNSNGTVSDTIPGLNPSIGGMLCEMTMPLFFAGVQYQAPAQRRWLADNLHSIELRCGWATAGMIGHSCETTWCRQGEAGRGPPYTRRGHWGKPDTEAELKSPWSYGVRGGESDAPPAPGLDGQQGISTEGLPIRTKPDTNSLRQEARFTKPAMSTASAEGRQEYSRRAHVSDTGRTGVFYAMGVMAEHGTETDQDGNHHDN